jgi:transposase-like protein
MYPKNLRPQPEDRTAALLSAKEAARLLGVHHNTLRKWRIRGVGARFGDPTSETWLQSRTYENTTEYGRTVRAASLPRTEPIRCPPCDCTD